MSAILAADVINAQRKRKLIEEVGTEKVISGKAFYGISYDVGVTNDISEHTLAHNITGLPQCTNNCNISVALSTSQECTEETNDNASFVPLLDDLIYTTDEEGSTGVKSQSFNVDNENPTGEQLLVLFKNVLENPTQAQELNLSSFFYDVEGELVACAFFQPAISDEDIDLAKNILELNGSKIGDGDVENDTTVPVVAATDGGSSARASLLSFVAIGLCVLFA